MARFSQPVADAMASYRKSRLDSVRWISLVVAVAFLAAGVVLLVEGAWLGVVPLVVAVYAGTVAGIGFRIRR